MENNIVSTLDDFLNLPKISELYDMVYLKRLNLTLKINAMSDKQFRAYQKSSKLKLKTGIDFDFNRFSMDVVSNHIIEPDFSNKAFLDKVGCNTADEFISKTFLPGEITDIYVAISTLSGFEKDIDELVEEAKN